MQISSVHNISFQSKARFISPKTNDGLKQILSNMNEESIIINKDKAHMLKSLTVDGNNVLYDNRTSVSQPIKLALFDIGSNKNQLVIDTETGEIIDYHKSFFSTWYGILKKVSQSVEKILEHFENEKIVKREYLTVSNR